MWLNQQHYFFSGAKEQLDLFNEFIKGHLVQGKSVLLWPIINDEHWHLLEIDMESAKAKHYSSCGHELYDDSCKRIISFVERFSRNAAGGLIQLTYVPVACQQQSMRYLDDHLCFDGAIISINLLMANLVSVLFTPCYVDMIAGFWFICT